MFCLEEKENDFHQFLILAGSRVAKWKKKKKNSADYGIRHGFKFWFLPFSSGDIAARNLPFLSLGRKRSTTQRG